MKRRFVSRNVVGLGTQSAIASDADTPPAFDTPAAIQVESLFSGRKKHWPRGSGIGYKCSQRCRGYRSTRCSAGASHCAVHKCWQSQLRLPEAEPFYEESSDGRQVRR